MVAKTMVRQCAWWMTLCGVLALVCGLVACGGGGGGGEGGSPVQAPQVTTAPASLTVAAGSTATFSVAASGTDPLTYQWLRNGVAITGATGSSYTTAAAVDGDNGALFSVRVANSAGQATSAQAMLTVTPLAAAPTITSGPTDATVAEGQTASFSVQASSPGSAASYQWRRNGEDIAGATSASYSTGATSAADQGAAYAVVVTNANGSTVGGPALLTVNSPPRVTTAPQNASHFVGETATFSVSASGTAPFTYSWLRNGVALAGANAAAFTTPALGLADNGVRYSVQVSNALGRVVSTEAVLTVAPVPVAPAISTQPQDTTVLAGGSASFSVTASGSGTLTYQWFKNGSAIAGATAASYTTPVLAWTDTLGGYSVVVGNGASGTSSRTAVLTVNPRVTQVAAGTSMVMALMENGQVQGMGRTAMLAVGTPATNATTTPQWARQPDGQMLSGITGLAVGWEHTLAWNDEGALWAWGANESAQLGSGNYTAGYFAERVRQPGGSAFGGVRNADGGIRYSTSVGLDGSVAQWGSTPSGLVLTPSVANAADRVPLADIRQTSAYADHAAALKGDGTVWLWGSAQFGALGNGTSTGYRNYAAALTDAAGNLVSGAKEVRVGAAHSVVLMQDGTVLAFGRNFWGELGDGTQQQRLWAVPVRTSDGRVLDQVKAIQASSDATAYLRTDGTVWMTGRNVNGLMGRPTSVSQVTSPTRVLMANGQALDGVVQLSMHGGVVVVLRQDGTVWGWGATDKGQLGTTTSFSSGCVCATTPVQLPLGR